MGSLGLAAAAFLGASGAKFRKRYQAGQVRRGLWQPRRRSLSRRSWWLRFGRFAELTYLAVAEWLLWRLSSCLCEHDEHRDGCGHGLGSRVGPSHHELCLAGQQQRRGHTPPSASPQQQLPNSSVSRSVQRSRLPQDQRNTRYLEATETLHRLAALE